MPVRVVSLVPSVTETLRAWGVDPVACTRFCEQPDLPHVGGTKDPDHRAIAALAPDLVVLCEEENRLADATAFEAEGQAMHVIRLHAVDEVEGELARLAEAVGLASPPPFALPERGSMTPLDVRAFVPIWRRPWMTIAGNTYASSMLERLGVHNVYRRSGRTDAQRYPDVTLEETEALRPDVVLAPSEPYPFRARHIEELSTVAPVILIDGQDLLWWGVRTPDALRRLHDTITAALG